MRQALIFVFWLATATAKSVPAGQFEQLEQQSIPIESIPVSAAQDSAALHSAKQYESSQYQRSQSTAPQLSFSWGRPASSGAGDALVTYNPVKYNMKLSRASSGSSGPVMQGAVQQVSRTVSYRTVAMPAASSRPAPTIEIPSNSNQVHLLFKSRSSPMYGTFSGAPGAAKPATSVYITTENHPSRFVPSQTSGVQDYGKYMRPVQYSTHVVMPSAVQESVSSQGGTGSSGGRHLTPPQRQVYQQVSQVSQAKQVSQGTQGGQGIQGVQGVQGVQGYRIQPGQIYEVPTQVMGHTVQYVSPQAFYTTKGRQGANNSYKSAMEAARDILGEAHFNSLYGNQRQASGTSGTSVSKPAVSKSTYTSSWSSATGSLAPTSVQQVFTRTPSIPVSAYAPQQKTTYITKVQSRVRPAPVHVIQAPKPVVAPTPVEIAQPTVSQVQPAGAVSYGQQHQQQQQQQFSQQKEDQLNQQAQNLVVPVQTVNVQEAAPAQGSQFHAVQEQNFVPVQPQTVSIQQAQPLVVPVLQAAPQPQTPITYQIVPQTVSAGQTSQVQEAQTLAVPVQTVNVQESAPVQGSQFTAVQEQHFLPEQPQTVSIQTAPQPQQITYQIVPQTSQIQEAQTLSVPAVQEQFEYVPSFQTRRTVQVRPLVQTTELITPQTAGSKVVQASNAPSVPAPVSVPKVLEESVPAVVEYLDETSQAVQGQSEEASGRVVQGFHQGRQFVPAEYEQQQQQQQQVSVQQAQPLEIQPIEAGTVETGRPAVQVQYQTVAQPVVIQKVQTKYVQAGGAEESSTSSGSTSYFSTQPGTVPVEIVQIQPESVVEFAAPVEASVQEGAVQEGAIQEGAQPVEETPAVIQPAPVESTSDLTYSDNSGAQEQSVTAESGRSASGGVTGYGNQPQVQPQEQPQVQPDEQNQQQQQQQYFTSADQQFQQVYAPYDDNYQPSR